MKTDQQLSLQQYLDVAWRRKWWILLPLLVSMGVTAWLYQTLPREYRSSTLILVEPQKVPQDYVKSAVSGSIADRLTTIRQQILSRSLLQKIMDEFGLYREESERKTHEELFEHFRKKITIETAGSRKKIESFTLSFSGREPAVVMKVTDKLASIFIEENLKIREQLVEGTSDFLENELSLFKKSLVEQEEKLSAFKTRYRGELPQQLDTNLRTLDRYQMELQSISMSIKVAEERKTNLAKMLSERAVVQTEQSPITLDPAEPVLRPEALSLARLKQELERLRTEYKESYPDVILLKNKIRSLEASLVERHSLEEGMERAAITEEEMGRPAPPLQRTAFSRDLERQYQQTSSEIRSLKERQRVILGQIKLLEQRVENTPDRELQIITLQRDYENTKNNYQALLNKKLNAQISQNLERRQKAERFRILDGANLPEKPFKPKLKRLLVMGLAMGLGAGLGLVLLIEMLDTSFKKPEEIEDALGLPVLVSIPRFSRKIVKVELLAPQRGKPI